MATRVEIRLYRTRLGAVGDLTSQLFGNVAFVPSGNNLLLRIDLRARYSAAARQGRSPNVVEVRIAR